MVNWQPKLTVRPKRFNLQSFVTAHSVMNRLSLQVLILLASFLITLAKHKHELNVYLQPELHNTWVDARSRWKTNAAKMSPGRSICQLTVKRCWHDSEMVLSFTFVCLFLHWRLSRGLYVNASCALMLTCTNTRILAFIWISKRNVGINWGRTWKRLEEKTVSTGCIMSSLRCGGMSAISQREGPIFSLRTTRCF